MKSDLQLKKDVEDELEWEPAVNAAEIGVEVTQGIVTLDGHVAKYSEKLAAEKAVQRIAGVKAVVMNLEVKLTDPIKRTDTDIARAAANVLDWSTTVPSDRVKVKVESGWITLIGEVDWSYQREAAESAVRHLRGVCGVSNRITVRPQVSPIEVKSKIQAALRRRALRDAQNIEVSAEGGKVVLQGTVHSWAERDAARSAAWCAPGVHEVVDQIAVAA